MQEACQKATSAYLEAITLAKACLPAHNPERLQILLNYSLFCYDVL